MAEDERASDGLVHSDLECSSERLVESDDLCGFCSLEQSEAAGGMVTATLRGIDGHEFLFCHWQDLKNAAWFLPEKELVNEPAIMVSDARSGHRHNSQSKPSSRCFNSNSLTVTTIKFLLLERF